MKTEEILQRIDLAISVLFNNEMEILRRGLNELNISNHLAKYLSIYFPEFNVDPEYNGDIDKPNDRKSLDIAQRRMIEIGFTPNKQNNYQLSPDIIIHQRNTNEHNLVVFEVKKDSNSKKNKEFDFIKLEHLTIDYIGNHYNYKLGVAIEFGTKENAGKVIINYFQDGILLDRNSLK